MGLYETLTITQAVIFVNTRRKVDWLTNICRSATLPSRPCTETWSSASVISLCRSSAPVPPVFSSPPTSSPVVLTSSRSRLSSTLTSPPTVKTTSTGLAAVAGSVARVSPSTLSPPTTSVLSVTSSSTMLPRLSSSPPTLPTSLCKTHTTHTCNVTVHWHTVTLAQWHPGHDVVERLR